MNEAASPRIRKTMVFVLLALFLGQFGSGVYDLIFSNFLRDAQHLDVEMRGLIEFPRELPGILSLFVVSLLFMFNEVRMAGVACLLMFGGMYALAFCGAGTSLWTLSAWILTVSLGQHILMGMIDTIVIHTARPENRSLRLGQMKALGTAAALLGALCVWIKWKFNQSFAVDFFVTGGVCLLASLFLSRVKTPVFPQRRGWRQCFVFKRRYAVYYGLEILHGIRKQLYLTFGFWLMVSTLGQSPGYIGKTLLMAGVIGLVTQPLIGWSIKRYGERKVTIFDSVALSLLCLAYAFAPELLPLHWAVGVVTACFVLDNLLFALGMARSTYVARICEKPEDITPIMKKDRMPTASLGITPVPAPISSLAAAANTSRRGRTAGIFSRKCRRRATVSPAPGKKPEPCLPEKRWLSPLRVIFPLPPNGATFSARPQ